MTNTATTNTLLALLLAATATACGGAGDASGDDPSQVSAPVDDEGDSVASTNAAPLPGTAGDGEDQAAEEGTDLTSPEPGTATDEGVGAQAEAPATDLDADGVRMLLPSATGTSFRLGASDPNDLEGFLIENDVVATKETLGSLGFWNTKAFSFGYTAGGAGKTSRLHIVTGPQKYTWKSQTGFLSSPTDLKNQEFTAYVRVHDIFDAAKGMVTMKIRGGQHDANHGDLASCTMMTLGANGKTMFGKELTHPLYDYVTLTPHFDASLKDGAWVGMKLVSYAKPGDPTKVVNQLYLDTAPFDAAGKPVNGWRLFSEYVDSEGTSTGRYSKLADWGGEQTTIRTDGVSSLDFAFVSAREVTPPN
jgi:hypothetical protein